MAYKIAVFSYSDKMHVVVRSGSYPKEISCLFGFITAALSSKRTKEIITYSIAGIYVKQYC